MKYIIESNDVIGYTPKYAMLFGDGYMIQRLEDLEELNSDYINEHFGDLQDEAYKKGLHDGESKCRYCNEYQRGLDDAWECMKKIAFLEKPRDMRDFLGHTTFGGILTGYTAAEAIAKLKAYEEKQKAEDDIKLGDVLEHTVSGYTSKAIFLEKIEDDEDWYKCLFWTGCGLAILSYPKSQFKRIGKHFDIDKILAEMRT